MRSNGQSKKDRPTEVRPGIGIGPRVRWAAPTFFGMAIDGSLELAQMAVARLYDTTRNTMSVPEMLKRADQEGGSVAMGRKSGRR